MLQVFWSLKHKIIGQVMPIHDQEDLKELRNKWVFSLAKRQPLGKKLNIKNPKKNIFFFLIISSLDKICKYFGIKLALYFAWLGFYTRALVIPAVLGLAMWVSMGKSEV